jgi:outer membrane protein assembly factor BamD (BamD/ComL family)
MSVAGILSNSLFNDSIQSAQSKLQQSRQVFQQLGQDLQSGNLPAAQTDFAALQPSGSSSSVSSLLQSANPIAQGFKQLSQDLQSGNVSSAQQDYAKIQQDFQNQGLAKHGHHHHAGGGGATSGVSQLLEQLRPSGRTAHCSRISRNLPWATGPCSHRQRQLRARSR